MSGGILATDVAVRGSTEEPPSSEPSPKLNGLRKEHPAFAVSIKIKNKRGPIPKVEGELFFVTLRVMANLLFFGRLTLF
jgi:hypothetical protein